jgi:hypothetical protein
MTSSSIFSSDSSAKTVNFKNQDYEQLKARHLQEGRLFEDETFPASDVSINLKKPLGGGRIVWKRPWVGIYSCTEYLFQKWGS